MLPNLCHLNDSFAKLEAYFCHKPLAAAHPREVPTRSATSAVEFRQNYASNYLRWQKYASSNAALRRGHNLKSPTYGADVAKVCFQFGKTIIQVTIFPAVSRSDILRSRNSR